MRARRALAGRAVVALSGLVAVLGSVLVAASVSTGPSIPAVPAVLSEAPDAATAGLAARRQGTRVEVLSERTETRTMFANPEGALTSELTVVPTRVRRGGGWVPVDTAMAFRADGSVGPRAAVGDLALSGGGAEAPLARLTRDGKALALFWPSALPRPVLAGNSATYPEVLPGVDLVMRAERTGYRQHLVVKNAEAARDPALAEIRLRVSADGLRVTVEDSGAITVADGAGAPVFTAPPSTMWDSSGPEPATSRSARVGVTLSGDTLTLRPDQALLSDRATVFPVVVDPEFTTYNKWGWATVLSGKPDGKYWWTSGDGPNVAQVGQCYRTTPDRCGGIGEAWAYFQFDTSFLSGRTVYEAFFDTRVVWAPDCNAPRTHLLWKSWSGISSTTSWNNRPAEMRQVDMKEVPTACNGPAPLGFYAQNDINITSMTTFHLKAADPGDQRAWRKYDPAETKLRVTHNRAPNTPYNLRMDPQLKPPCRWCDGKSYVGNEFVSFITEISDPDNDSAFPRWRTEEIWPDGHKAEGDWEGPAQTSGATHRVDNIDLRSKHNVEFRWWVHGRDRWNDRIAESAAAYFPGSFVADRVGVPVAPTVTSATYPEDNSWHGGVGVPGTFTFGANGVEDIDHYLYGWQDPPSETSTVDASALGGPATVTKAPDQDGPQTLYVQSVDRAGHKSPVRAHRVYVRAGNGPRSQWSFEGNANDTAFLGDRHATLTGGAGYAHGAVGTSLLLNGTQGTGMTAPNTVRTDASFSVSAWVKLDRVDDHRYTVVSQDGDVAQGFYLQYEGDKGPEGDRGRWVFAFPGADVAQVPDWYFVESPDRPVAGEWTHLAGTYDSASRQIRLYVNGISVGTVVRHTEWNAPGALRVGNLKAGTGLYNHLPGAVDEVRLYDRVISEAEVLAAVSRDNVQVGHWRFDEKDGTTARNSVEGGQHIVLKEGAAFVDGGAVDRAVQFDGTNDHAVADGPAVRTDHSFTVMAWVHPRQLTAGGASMTAVSQDGDRHSGFFLRYNGAAGGDGKGRWEFLRLTSDKDDPGPEWIGIQASSKLPRAGDWMHLAGVYDASTRQMRIYVNGELDGQGALSGTPWNAARPLTIGRAKRFGNHIDYWDGMVDEVRLYSRVLAAEEIRGVMSRAGVTSGDWRLDGNADDASPFGRTGEVRGNPAWGPGQTGVPDPADLAILLDGKDDHVRGTTAAVDTAQSFSVAAWVRPDKPGSWSTVVSQDGTHTSGFSISAAGDGRWHLFAARADQAGTSPPGDWVVAGSVQYGVWTHVAGVYSRERNVLELYVNGVLTGSAPHATWIDTSGPWQIGRVKWNDQHVNYFAGAVDDVKLYGRQLYATEIVALAGRDLSLVHNWRFDESAGTNAADAVCASGATLDSGASHGDGRLGNAVRLNGTGAYASTPAVDLRTDQNFTVSSWVRLDRIPSCATRCKLDAVSLDGGQENPVKFRLGHVRDTDQAPEGKWIFEMPEKTGTITRAAVSVRPGQIGTWVHLVGVYDAPSKLISLYVQSDDGNDQGHGTLVEPWNATGGLQIGRGIVNGQPGEFWPGSVDEVRLYTGAFDLDRVNALYTSYPADEIAAETPVADAGHWKLDEKTGTTAADSSGRGNPATLKNGAGWSGGRVGGSTWLDGTDDHAQTAGPVLDTTGSFSVATWVFLSRDTGGNRTAIAQDGRWVSTFLVQYNENARSWAAVVPVDDVDNPDPARTVVLTSAQPAQPGTWTHLAMTYHAQLRQLRLYVNGYSSAVQVGVTVKPAPGPLSIGRAKWHGANTDHFPGGVDDVRAFGRALTAGEIRRIHDEAPPVAHGWWGFEDSPNDSSWRNVPVTLSGGSSYVDGARGKALSLDGTGAATVGWSANMVDSFTVSAWAKLSTQDHDATVVAQNGDRASGFVVQYHKSTGRWIFGGPSQDADNEPLFYAYSNLPAQVGQWTHLTAVYDHPARQIRLYVNGELSGIRDNAYLRPVWREFTIGRGKANGVPAGFFAGVIDEVRAELGVVPEEEIRGRGTFPVPAGGQLGRFVDEATGDHLTANSTGDHGGTFTPMPPGYRYEGPLGKVLPNQRPNTKMLYTCRFTGGTNTFTSVDRACENHTFVGELGWVYTAPQTGVATVPLRRCWTGQDHYDSLQDKCEHPEHANNGVIGYPVAYAALVRYVHPPDGKHVATVTGAPGGYRRVGTLGLLSMVNQPGTQPLYACREGVEEFLTLDVNCEGKTSHAWMGALWKDPPTATPSVAIYGCRLPSGNRFVSTQADCEGNQVLGPLGHVLTAVPAAPASE